jgi:hypothetical protein
VTDAADLARRLTGVLGPAGIPLVAEWSVTEAPSELPALVRAIIELGSQRVAPDGDGEGPELDAIERDEWLASLLYLGVRVPREAISLVTDAALQYRLAVLAGDDDACRAADAKMRAIGQPGQRSAQLLASGWDDPQRLRDVLELLDAGRRVIALARMGAIDDAFVALPEVRDDSYLRSTALRLLWKLAVVAGDAEVERWFAALAAVAGERVFADAIDGALTSPVTTPALFRRLLALLERRPARRALDAALTAAAARGWVDEALAAVELIARSAQPQLARALSELDHAGVALAER